MSRSVERVQGRPGTRADCRRPPQLEEWRGVAAWTPPKEDKWRPSLLCVAFTRVPCRGGEEHVPPKLCQCLPGLITATEVGPCSRARNFAAAQATQVASSGMVVQTFPFSDLVTSSACDLPTWSPRGAKGGVVQLPRWPGLRLLHRPIGKYQQRRASSEGSELRGRSSHPGGVFRDDGPDLPLHRSGDEHCLPEALVESQPCEVRGGQPARTACT